MTLPSSGQISFSALQSEFGGSNPISLGEYRPGTGLVPKFTSGINGLVPTSNVGMSKFRGSGKGSMFTFTAMYFGPGTNMGLFVQIDAGANLVIAAGDKLVYSMRATAVPPGVSGIMSGVELHFSNPQTILSGSTQSDQNGYSAKYSSGIPTSYINQWYDRIIDLSACAGYTLDVTSVYFTYGNSGGSLSNVATQFANIFILDSNNNIKRTIFKDSLNVTNNVQVTLGVPASGYVPQSKTVSART